MSGKEKEKRTFAPPPEEPTQVAVDGITFDFNYGLRVKFPEKGNYKCVFLDRESGALLYSMEVPSGVIVESRKKFFVNFALEIYRTDDLEKPIFSHDLDMREKDVLIQLPVGALGDTIAWFSYIERFRTMHGCRIFCTMAKEIAEIFKFQYPEITFISIDDAEKMKPYATYRIGLFFDDHAADDQPFDFRAVGLHRTAGAILGLKDLSEIPPRVDLSAPDLPDREKTVVIATQASSQAKYWNHPGGWRIVADHFKKAGYRVICIDRFTGYGFGPVWNEIPYGVEDETGPRSLQERIDRIKNATVFIGLSSGLSWLAWCCKVPVVLISGFTEPYNEFFTPYRVHTSVACHGCWNDPRCSFDHKDFLWCPRMEKLEEKFQCTASISPDMVIAAAERAIADRKKSF